MIIMDLAKRSKKSIPKDILPWRDSKLTMMLKKCMDGNSYFSFIACLSPLYINQFETINTLEYASFCKNITITPQKIEDPTTRLINSLKNEIKRLKAEIVYKDTYIDMLVVKERENTKMYICDYCNEVDGD